MKLRDLDMLSIVIMEMLCGQEDEIAQAFVAATLYDVVIPPAWCERFHRADKVLDAMHDTVLSDVLPENLLECGLRDLCSPNDNTITIVLEGDLVVVDHVLSAVEDGAVAQEVLEAVRCGELASYFKVSHARTEEPRHGARRVG